MRTRRGAAAVAMLLGLLLGGLAFIAPPAAQAAAPECSDGVDNDGDVAIDYPFDTGCTSPSDTTESPNPQCDDKVDNDGDGKIDTADTGCSSSNDDSESPDAQCSDGVDNDGDGQTDYPSDFGCTGVRDNTESPNPACSDGVDNDSDGQVDYPADPGCSDPSDKTESCGSDSVYAVCFSTGAEIDRVTVGNVTNTPDVVVRGYLDVYRFTVANVSVNAPCVVLGVDSTETPSPCATLGGDFVSRTTLVSLPVDVPSLGGPEIVSIGLCEAELTATVLGIGISSAEVVTTC